MQSNGSYLFLMLQKNSNFDLLFVFFSLTLEKFYLQPKKHDFSENFLTFFLKISGLCFDYKAMIFSSIKKKKENSNMKKIRVIALVMVFAAFSSSVYAARAKKKSKSKEAVPGTATTAGWTLNCSAQSELGLF